ncbi:NADH dehydrogenase [ubiquinone] 1 beta subcomplex subunit 7-like [Pollicipes pollicipes]|uniref:NADH dehydrogenase [ubiquinone] 1 beta subcomplex subunit 7-like n=1 Tax=Pollicipes pollicipes TaxID=41117 RepID=UPI00188498B4|nr:NADH dehydrogenase [ubiquinone] 1 beta subcomplex subunit 7-like [Pollicipes pollicipes]
MGHWVSRYYLDPAYSPDHHSAPTFEPNYGFPAERKERVMVATEEEMSSAKLEPEQRGYCAHKLIAFNRCKRDHWPLAYKCAHEKHELANCEYDDYMLRLREYERERRLLQRKKRLEERERKLAAEELVA